MKERGLIYAIDFGTSNSLLCASDGEQVFAPVPLDSDSAGNPADASDRKDPTILRSILYFPTMKQVFYGAQAIREFAAHDMTGRLIRSIKKFLPVRSFVGTYVEDRPLNLENIIGLFLKEMKRRADAHYGQDVNRVVLGRPARFSPDDADDRFAQGRLEQAARLAGFREIEFCAEPVAAAREFRSQAGESQTVVVADFGGGTSDFTVMRVGRAGETPEVLSIGGVAVAGDALDGSIMRHQISRHFGADVEYQVPFGANILKMPVSLMEKICSPADISLLRRRDTMEFFRNVKQWSLGEDDREKMDRLFALLEDQLGFHVFEEIERTKRALSDQDQALFEFRYPDIDIRDRVRRKRFEEFSHAQLQAILNSLDDTLKAAQLAAGDVDLVCCTGGTAKVHAIHQGLAQRFGAERLRQHRNFHSVVLGLGERARDLS